MATKKSTVSNWVITATICIVLLAAIILCVIAVVSSGSGEAEATATPTPTATKDTGEEEDSFDPNEIVVRENPTVMTVDLLPVKYSEFCYFYYISAGEVLEKAESPEDVIANGIDGVPFKTLIMDMAKEYAAKYVLYRDAYESENYVINETYRMYLESNFMRATDKEELDQMNQDLLYQYGVVRNEYIDIMLYNDAIANYRTVLQQRANYSEDELKAFYDAHKELFPESAGTFEAQKEAIRNYMAVYEFDDALVQKIKNQEVEITVEETILESLQLPLFIDQWTENTEA